MSPLDEHGLVRLASVERAALVAFARRRLGSAGDDAEDVVQDALVRALRALRGGSQPTDGRAWLFTIVAHCCADQRLGAARRPTQPILDGVELADAGPSVARAAEARAEVASAVRAIAALPAAQRQALVGYELGGDTYEELGARHGWSVSATKSLLWRARSRLVEERAGWAAVGGAPLTALRALLGHAERAVVATPWGAEALGCVAVAALGTAAVALPDAPTPAAAAPPARHAPPHAPRRADAGGATALTLPAGMPTSRSPGTAAPGDRPGPRSADPQAVIAACTAGTPLAHRFTPTALLRAQRALPADAAEYTDCTGAIDRAVVQPG